MHSKRSLRPRGVLRLEQLERRECPATVSISGGREVTEGATNVALQVTLSEPLAVRASVGLSTAGSTAQFRNDYTLSPLLSRNRINFLPGETSKTIFVNIRSDTTREPTERVSVSLTAPINCTLGSARTAVTILDDDSYSVAMLGPVGQVNEGSQASFLIQLSSPATKAELFRISAIGEIARSGRDFAAFTNRMITVPRGATSAAFSIPIFADGTPEADETFLVRATAALPGTPLPRPLRVTISGSAAPPPLISVSDASVVEGNQGAVSAIFRVNLSSASTSTVTVAYSTIEETATVSYGDFTPVSGTLMFAPGETSKTVAVPVQGDTIVESDETFVLILTAAANASLGRSIARATIINDDALPVVIPAISVSDPSLAEGNSGTKMAVFSVTLSQPTTIPVSVIYTTGGGTGSVGSDYVSSTGTLVFNPGEYSKTIAVAVVGDLIDEADESFTLTVQSPVNATLAKSVGTATIVNDDAPSGSWTIMVYMTGGNLNDSAFADINEMEWALTKLPASVNIVVSWDQWTGWDSQNQHAVNYYPTGYGSQAAWRSYGRSVLVPDATPFGPQVVASSFQTFSDDKNTGDPATLAEFVKWGASQAPAQRYLLMMWGHGGGLLGSNRDSESGNDDMLIPEMVTALSSPGVPSFDIVGYDNCNMGMTEVAYALSPFINGYFVGSEETVPGYGHDYTTVLSALTQSPYTVPTAAVAAGIVQSYQAQKASRFDVRSTYAAISSSGMPTLANTVQQFVASTKSLSFTEWTILRIWSTTAHTYGGYKFADLGQFMNSIAASSALPSNVRVSASAVASALQASVLVRTTDTWNSNGLAIYLRADGIFDSRYLIDAAPFISATGWAQFVYTLSVGS